MKWLDEMEKICTPVNNATTVDETAYKLSEETIKKVADMVVEKMNNSATSTQETTNDTETETDEV